jgi:tetratricopeptide (TPR) repeat protein
MSRARTFSSTKFLVLIFCAAATTISRASEPHWIRVSSSHFSVMTDADEKRAHEVAVRFEQMRSVFSELLMRTRINFSKPLDIIALKDEEQYIRVAPVRDGHLIAPVAFFLASEDRNFIVLNLSQAESWRAVSYDLARMFLSYNYPPTQPWFDEGFAEYFSSLRLAYKQVQIGGDPGLVPPNAKPFVTVLQAQSWLSISDLFAAKQPAALTSEPRETLFSAQSWIVMHYLLNKNQLSETGTYFDLVQNQKLPIADAIQKAYGVSAGQFEQSIKDYFATILPLLQAQPSTVKTPGTKLAQMPNPPPEEDIGTSTQELSQSQGQASLLEVGVRLPEHRDAAEKQLQSIMQGPKTDNAIAHRAMAWAYLQKNEFNDAASELDKAAQLDPKDPWIHYYLALMKYHMAQKGGQELPGLSNIIQDMQAVLDWDPEFAEAYNMLAMARVEGGGPRSAMEAMRAAIQLSPRNQTYLLNMARIYIAAKQWDAATAMLTRLKDSENPEIAKVATAQLADLPTLRKYGLLPQHEAQPASQTAQVSSAAHTTQSASAVTKSATNETSDNQPEPPAEPQLDLRPVRYLKGRLISVDCSQAPVAIVNVAIGSKNMKLRTPDYKSLTLIGADQFSCDWANRSVSANFKPGGKADGDLVSLEIY